MYNSIMKCLANAKLNLSLEVLSKEHTGFHKIKSIFHEVSISDEVSVEKSLKDEINVSSKIPIVNSTIDRAISFFRKESGIYNPVRVIVEKNIPIGGGLGGGSSDAAKVLIALNELFDNPVSFERLLSLGAKIGKDIPFFFYGGTALVEEKGEKVTPISTRFNGFFVVVVPNFHISTRIAYFIFDKYGNFSSGLKMNILLKTIEEMRFADDLNDLFYNDFEEVYKKYDARFRNLFMFLKEITGFEFHLTGSGSCVFRVFSNTEQAMYVKELIEKNGMNSLLCKSTT